MENQDEKFKDLPRPKESVAELAFRGLERYMGKEFFAVSSTELGGLNTAEALHIACVLGLPLADADPAGRSVPELQHSTYYIKGVPIAPMGIASEYGDVAIFTQVANDLRAEEWARALAVASNHLVGVADHPTTGKIYRESVIVGAISYARRIGEILRETRKAKGDVAKEIANAMGGAVLFKGIVQSMPWELEGGFNYGEIVLKGIDEYVCDEYKIWFKNENLISYRNGSIDITCPDLICAFDDTGEPVTNPDAKIGSKMTVIVLPAPEIWKTKEGLDCFGPRSFGFDVDYVPFKKD